MRPVYAPAALVLGVFLSGCGDGSSSSPTPTTTTTTAPRSTFEIQTLLTVYTRAADLAQFTRGTANDDEIGRILLGVDTLTEGRTTFDNEAGRFELQAAVDRVNQRFSEGDWVEAFDESRASLERFFNDADGDGWSIDGRSGEGRDWPHDEDGNDPDGWTAQIVVTVTRR